MCVPDLTVNPYYSQGLASETASWQTLLTLDRKSDAFTELARRLLGEEKTRKLEASQFTEEEVPKLIEMIEQTVCLPLPVLCSWSEVNSLQILKHSDIAEELKSTAFTVLQRLCGTFERLPKTCVIKADFKIGGGAPVPTRAYTDLWKRDWNGRNVAVKALRFGPDDDRRKIMKVRISLLANLLGYLGKLNVTCRDSVKKYCCGNL